MVSSYAERSPRSCIPVQGCQLPLQCCANLEVCGRWRARSPTTSCSGPHAACAFFGFLHSGEVCVPSLKEYDADQHLSVGDVALDAVKSPSLVRVSIKASKTDPFCRGVDVFLGKIDNDLCPVAAVGAYLTCRGNKPGPFFTLQSGSPLLREVFVT